MLIPDLSLHISTGPHRHQVLMNTLYEYLLNTHSTEHRLDVALIGPGGVTRNESDFRILPSTINRALDHLQQKGLTHDLKNYEPTELVKTIGRQFQLQLTVIDNYLPCLECIPDEILIQNENGKTYSVPITKVHHNICEPYSSQFDAVFAAIVVDRIPKEMPDWLARSPSYRRLLNVEEFHRQRHAIHTLDSLVKPNGYLAVTYGKDSPDWSLWLKGYLRCAKNTLPQQYQLWHKGVKSQTVAKDIFHPPHAIVEVEGEYGPEKTTF